MQNGDKFLLEIPLAVMLFLVLYVSPHDLNLRWLTLNAPYPSCQEKPSPIHREELPFSF
jgi:hypothetical protein